MRGCHALISATVRAAWTCRCVDGVEQGPPSGRSRVGPECHRAILGGLEASKISCAGSSRRVTGWRLTGRLLSAPAVTLNAFRCLLLIATFCVALVLAENPGTVIEIGLVYGSSALAIAEALVSAGSNTARHVIVDAYQEHFHGSGRAAIAGAGLAGLCSLVEERSQIAALATPAHRRGRQCPGVGVRVIAAR